MMDKPSLLREHLIAPGFNGAVYVVLILLLAPSIANDTAGHAPANF